MMEKLQLNQIQQVGKLSRAEFKTFWERANAQDAEFGTHLFKLRCATDIELFASAYFPHYCEHPFNEFHRSDFRSFKYGERGVRRVRCAPRGSAKSTLKAFFKPIHDLCYGLEKYIIVISNTEQQAAQKLRDVRDELLTNNDLIKHYGIWFPKSAVAETRFEANAGEHRCRFEAYGVGTQIRGIRRREARPSKIIFDDVEHSEEVYNEALRDKFLRWFKEDVSKVGDIRTNIDGVGTMLHRDSLLNNIMKNPMYDSASFKSVVAWSERQELWDKWEQVLCNIDDELRLQHADEYYQQNEKEMLQGVKVLWPEREPYLYLMKERIEIGHRAFMKEKQNEPLGSEEKVFNKICWYREAEQEWNGKLERGVLIEATNVFIPFSIMRTYGVIDPASGQTKAKKGKKGDFACIAMGYTDPKGRLFVHRDWTRRAPPSEQMERIFTEHEDMQFEKFGVETNLYRNLLMPNIVAARQKIEKEKGRILKLSLYDIEQVENKHKRIYSVEPKVTNGWILFNRALSQEFINQVDDFPHADHDDCPDSVEMLWGLVNGRYKMSPVSLNPIVR